MTMKLYLSPTIFFLFSLFSLTSSAELPLSFQATYALHYDDLRIGVMERNLKRHSDGSATFESRGKLTGLAALFRGDKIVESTHFAIKDNYLQPINYSYARTGGKKEKIEKHRFDWQNQKVYSTTRDGGNTADITPGLLDKLLYQLAIMDVDNANTDLEFTLIDGTNQKTYKFTFEGEESLKTPMGSYTAYKYQRVHASSSSNKESKRSTILWVAPTLHNLPIRVDNVDRKGHLTSIVIKSVSGLK